MIKATLFASSLLYMNNRQFDMSDTINRDDCLYGFYLLKKRFEEDGIDLSTQDINPPSESQFIIYNEMPKITDNLPDKDKYLLIFESEVIRLDNWDKEYHKYFKKIFTWNDKWVDSKKYIKFYWPNKILQNLDVSKKTKFCTMIVGNKATTHPLELYTERRKTIRWFEQNHPEDFDLYGMGWNKSQYPSYRGIIKSKREVLQKYKFSICYENVKELTGYITEKIFDCFFAGCVPIYWGASNITDYIPVNAFIDRRNFKDNKKLYNYLKNMPDKEYVGYIHTIKNFVESNKIYPFSAEYFAETIVSEIEKDNILSHSAVNCSDFVEFFKDIKLDTIVEIGTYKGMSAAYMAQFANKIYTFDIYDYPEKYKVWKDFRIEDRIFYYTIRNRKDIKNVLDKIEFEVAFIDGNHTYEDVKADFELVKHCGRVLFHDIHIEGIKKFVKEIGATEIKTLAYWTKQ